MSFASRWKGIGRPASGGATLNWKPPRRPHKRPPKKGLQNGVRDRNRHRDRSAPRHGRRRRVGPRGHRDGCAPHGDACGGPRRGTTTQRRYLGPCRPDVTLRLRAVGALRRPAWQELRERAGASPRRALEAAPRGLTLDARRELARRRVSVFVRRAFDRSRVGDRAGVAHGRAFFVPLFDEPSGCLPGRSTNSFLRTGTPVPSIPRYSVGASGSFGSGGSTTSFSSSATSRPSASAARSTCLVGTSTPANSCSNSWPSSKLTMAPTSPAMRSTPGESEPPWSPSARSRCGLEFLDPRPHRFGDPHKTSPTANSASTREGRDVARRWRRRVDRHEAAEHGR